MRCRVCVCVYVRVCVCVCGVYLVCACVEYIESVECGMPRLSGRAEWSGVPRLRGRVEWSAPVKRQCGVCKSMGLDELGLTNNAHDYKVVV